MNKDKCRCECKIDYSWNVNNYRCDMKKLTALIECERFLETDVETDEIKNVSECKAFPENKTITLIKR